MIICCRYVLCLLASLCILFLFPTSESRGSTSLPTLEELAGAMIMIGFRGTEAPEPLLKLIRQGAIGGVVLFDRDIPSRKASRNILNRAQVTRLIQSIQEAAPRPLLIAVDQEGGKVCRLKPKHGFMPLPSAAAMGKASPEKTRQRAQAAGQELASVGINMDFAPCVDVNRNADSPVIGKLGRSFGATPEMATAHGQAFAEGLTAAGVIPTLKHFPGHGNALADSHKGLTDITATWQKEEELAPYHALLRQGYGGAIMVSHLIHTNLDPVFPASLSKAVITDLLRGELGWQGVVISDDLQMDGVGYPLRETVIRAVLAGTDILAFGNNLHYVEPTELVATIRSILVGMVVDGLISRERLEISWNRIEAMKARAGLISSNIHENSK